MQGERAAGSLWICFSSLVESGFNKQLGENTRWGRGRMRGDCRLREKDLEGGRRRKLLKQSNKRKRMGISSLI